VTQPVASPPASGEEIAMEMVLLPRADYERLRTAAVEGDDMLGTCDQCGAWIDRDDPAWAHVEDFDGCWYAATGRQKEEALCYKTRRNTDLLASAADALLSDRAAMAERVAGLERERRDLQLEIADYCVESIEAKSVLLASQAEVARLREALAKAETELWEAADKMSVLGHNHPGALGATGLSATHRQEDKELAIKLSLRFTDAAMAARASRAALPRPMGEPKLLDGWLKEGIDAALTRPDEPTKET
jgi:hypothetical protein